MTPKQITKIYEAPYLKKEDFLFRLQFQLSDESKYINLKKKDIVSYASFLKEYGYNSGLLVNLKKPILEGRWVLEARKNPIERNLALRQIERLAGIYGQQIEDEVDFWLNGYEPGLEKIIENLDSLKFSGLPLEVYNHYLEIYNSAVELFGEPRWGGDD